MSVSCPAVYKWPILPGQADSQQGITAQLAGETGSLGMDYVTFGAENSLN